MCYMCDIFVMVIYVKIVHVKIVYVKTACVILIIMNEIDGCAVYGDDDEHKTVDFNC